MKPDDQDAIITKDRLILACAALDEIRALGGKAGEIAGDTLESFMRADLEDSPPETNGG